MDQPVICFGQQPCGFFPKRFLVAKINTARKLQAELGGKIVFFYHDSDADYRETITVMKDRQSGAEVRLNFIQENKLQKKFSPLYLKRIPESWKAEIDKQLPRFVDQPLIDMFNSVSKTTVADFCLDMYQKMKLLDGIEILRSGDKDFRMKAPELKDFYADVEFEGEIVRAEMFEGKLRLHEGGGQYLTIPTPQTIEKWQKNPGRDERFAWMNQVINCTHYIFGEGEKDYLETKSFPSIKFVDREKIDDPSYAYINL